MKVKSLIASIVLVASMVILGMFASNALGAGNATANVSGSDDSKLLIDTFVVIFIISFGGVSLIAGLFTTYFGAGKSRMIGVILTLIGLIILLLSGYFAYNEATTGPIDWGHVYIIEALVVIIATAAGGIVGVLLFLLAIMKA